MRRFSVRGLAFARPALALDAPRSVRLRAAAAVHRADFYAGSGPTCVTNPLNQTTLFNYDLGSGLQLSVTDPNNQTTSNHYDSMLRTTEIDYPDGGQTLFGYPNATEVQVSEEISSGIYKTTNLLVDGLGRLSQTQLTSDPD